MIEDAASALRKAGIAVSDLGLRRPTLDDVFLQLTGAPPSENGAGPEAVSGDGQPESTGVSVPAARASAVRGPAAGRPPVTLTANAARSLALVPGTRSSLGGAIAWIAGLLAVFIPPLGVALPAHDLRRFEDQYRRPGTVALQLTPAVCVRAALGASESGTVRFRTRPPRHPDMIEFPREQQHGAVFGPERPTIRGCGTPPMARMHRLPRPTQSPRHTGQSAYRRSLPGSGCRADPIGRIRVSQGSPSSSQRRRSSRPKSPARAATPSTTTVSDGRYICGRLPSPTSAWSGRSPKP